MKREIGGFLDIELRGNEEYHKSAIAINSCRNALRILVNNRNTSRVYLAYYTCSVVYDALIKENIEVIFYQIDENMYPLDVPMHLEEGELLLYVNYWGICNTQINKLISEYGSSLVIDAAQAFFYKPPLGIDCINSARKFFGVPDGAFLYLKGGLSLKLDTQQTFNSCSHLVKRLEVGAKESYDLYLEAEERINLYDICSMSILSRALLRGVNYDEIASIRKENFKILHESLGKYNHLNIDEYITDGCVPMTYPLLLSISIKSYLIESGVFIPTLWPNVKDWCNESSWEYRLADYIHFLPIDQRYSLQDMNYIIKLIRTKITKY